MDLQLIGGTSASIGAIVPRIKRAAYSKDQMNPSQKIGFMESMN